jgi:hypothetical protein
MDRIPYFELNYQKTFSSRLVANSFLGRRVSTERRTSL